MLSLNVAQSGHRVFPYACDVHTAFSEALTELCVNL